MPLFSPTGNIMHLKKRFYDKREYHTAASTLWALPCSSCPWKKTIMVVRDVGI